MTSISRTGTIVEFRRPKEELPQDSFSSRGLVLYDAPVERMEPFPAAITLGAIIEKYQHREDTLSSALTWFGREIMLIVQENNPSRQAFLANLAGLKAVLSIGRNLLNDPWVIGDMVGERPALDLYCRVLSMFSGQKVSLEEIGSPHVYAQEALDWIDALEGSRQEVQPLSHSDAEVMPTFRIVINEMGVPELEGFQLEPEEPITSLTSYVHGDIDIPTAFAVYDKFQKLIHGEIEVRQKIRFTEVLKRRNAILEKELAVRDEQRQQDLQRFKESTEQHTEDLAQGLHQIEIDCTNMVQRFEKTTGELRIEVKEEKSKLATSIAKINAQEVRIYGLEQNNARLWGEIQRLNNEVQNADGGCTIL